MVRRRAREAANYTLPFLSVMTGGFGAVVIIFLMLDPATETEQTVVNRDLQSSSRLLDYQIQTEEERIMQLQALVNSLREQIEQTEIDIEELLDESEIKEEDLEEVEEEEEEQAKSSQN